MSDRGVSPDAHSPSNISPTERDISNRPNPARINRRGFISAGAIGLGLLSASTFAFVRSRNGSRGMGHHDLTWGQAGIAKGRLMTPRAITADNEDRIYVVDKTARIQVYDRDGQFLHGWRTPDYANGKPTGLNISKDGDLMVADTHYYRILFYSPDGELRDEKTIGGEYGLEPGKFSLVTDVVEDSKGNIFVSEYGQFDRVQKFSPDGEFIFQWGGHGSKPGEFLRPQNMAIDKDDHLWIVDACNHRVQVFDVSGESAELIRNWGEHGYDLGQLRYPYDLIVDDEFVYVCEWGNHRVQKLTHEGEPVGHWGTTGRGTEELHNPWGICRDSQRRIHVLDTYNHRVQRIRL